MKGFFGKYLLIDASRKKWYEIPLEDSLLKKYPGGKALGTKLLLEHSPIPLPQPLSKENPLIIALGPATDSGIWGSSRYGVYTRSPLTGFYLESYSGGKVPILMSRTGYDAFVIVGGFEKLTWIEIGPGYIRFHDATGLEGKDTFETIDTLRNQAVSHSGRAIAIGLAGERLVSFANIANEYWRCAGRGGAGAVMGAKKIKGIYFFGDKRRPVYDIEGGKTFNKKIMDIARDHPTVDAYRKYGTPGGIGTVNAHNAFPSHYWSKGNVEDWEAIGPDTLVSNYTVRPHACTHCLMACGNLTSVNHGPYKGLTVEGPEYETLYALGGLCEICSLDEILHLNDLCDRMGIDTISIGNIAALLMLAYERGRIKESFHFGDAGKIESLIDQLLTGAGIGPVIMGGILSVARHFGIEDLAIHVKGMEPAGFDPRTLKGMALSYAVSDRGACHMRTAFYKPELSGISPPDMVEGKVELLIEYEDRYTIYDNLILCRFYRDLYFWDELERIIYITTGLKLKKEEMRTLALSITNTARQYNLHCGLTPSDDELPERVFSEPLAESGNSITKEDFVYMKNRYYMLRGWSQKS